MRWREYIRRIKFDFLWFSSQVDSFRKKNAVCIFLQAHEAQQQQEDEKREKYNNKKFHNIPKDRS